MKRSRVIAVIGVIGLGTTYLMLPPLLSSVYRVETWTAPSGPAGDSKEEDQFSVTIVPRRGTYLGAAVLQLRHGALFLGDKLVREEEAIAVVRELSKESRFGTVVIVAPSSERFGSVAHWADVLRGARLRRLVIMYDQEPNQSPEPTPTAGTSAAEQPLVPAAVVAHL